MDGFIEKMSNRDGRVTTDENRDVRKRERHRSEERREEREERNQRPRRKRRSIVLSRVRDWIRAADEARPLVERNGRELVVGEMAAAERAEKAHGLEMENVAVKQVFAEAEHDAAHKARQHDGAGAGGNVRLPRRREDASDKQEDQRELTKHERG